MIRLMVSSIRSALRPRPMRGRPYPQVASANPLLKNAAVFGSDPFRFMTENQRQYGDFYDVHLPHVPLFVLSKPEYAKHVLVTNNKKYGKSFAYEFLRHPLGNGLLTSEGDFWLKQRRIAQPAFHRERLSALATTIAETTQGMLQEWEEYARRQQPFNATHDLMRLTSRVVARALFGSDVADSASDIVGYINTINQHITEKVSNPFRLPLWLPNRKNRAYRHALQELDKLVYDIIENRHRTGKTYHDLLAMLMETEDADTGECMSDQQVRDEVVTLFIAGTETSAVALSWMLYLLARHPEEAEKVREEASRVLSGTPTAERVAQLVYTHRVVQETMRLYPPAWIMGREAREDDELDGYFIPRGSQVYICSYAIHRHPDIWEQPERFWPDRFDEKRVKERHKFAFFPFGGGPRYCIGNHFAIMEMQLALSLIVRKFDIKLDGIDEISVEPLITLRPYGGVPVRLIQREAQPQEISVS